MTNPFSADVITRVERAAVEELQRCGTPVVLVDRVSALATAPSVAVDDVRGGSRAAARLFATWPGPAERPADRRRLRPHRPGRPGGGHGAGHVLVQTRAHGTVRGTLEDLRALVRRTHDLVRYEPATASLQPAGARPTAPEVPR